MITVGEECDCPCHTTLKGNMKHIVSCCFECPSCQKKIGYRNARKDHILDQKREDFVKEHIVGSSRSDFIKEHLCSCTENPEELEKYLKVFGLIPANINKQKIHHEKTVNRIS